MSGETFGQRIKRFRERKGIGVRALARAAGIASHASIVQAEAGRGWTRIPGPDVTRPLAKALGVKHEVLIGEELEEDQPIPEPLPYDELLRRMGAMPDVPENSPIYEDLAGHLGRGGSFPGDIIDALPTWMDKESIEDLKSRFRLRVHGGCMEPLINDRDVLIFDKREPIEVGRVVAALVNMEETVIRRLVEREGFKLLIANQGHDPIPVDWRVQIAAVAVGGQYSLK